MRDEVQMIAPHPSSLIPSLSGLLLFALRRGLGERAEHAEQVTHLPDAHAVTVEKFLYGEIILQRVVALVRQFLGHPDEQTDIRLFQERISQPAMVGEFGML